MIADLAGTAEFAIEGAIRAMRSNLDLLGGMVIAFIVALGDGVVRDLLIGVISKNLNDL
ncbi:TRIC cation channel family protein [Pseudomonas laurylsulfatiphila]|uniref:TRIC cation channel family protein n=1 Tax=Pseudomonas laurylsulfatiphila TaxID=2011015 RepID=UPI0030B80E8F